MRLLTLEMTAFGPFAETARVDFGALGEAGVFLLCGDTGAGKTTVLDAVCFALYGDLPSDRGAAKQLRSQFAAEGVRPEVVLDAELSGRRLRFRRSPGWQRAKKRGAGTTTEQPRVLVEEHLAGEWVAVTTRLDEAGHLVTGLLGMTLSQFSQVVLLPQGQFDTFLSARSEDRQTVLTQLFRTRRFEEVERWLAERRRTLRRESERHRESVTTLLHRTAELTGVEPPPDLEPATLATAADHGTVRDWVADLLASARRLREQTAEALETATAARDTAEQDLERGRSTHVLQQRGLRATETLTELAEGAARAETDRSRLRAAQRAARVRPLVEVAQQAAAQAEASRRRAAAAAEEVGSLVATYAGRDVTGDDSDRLDARAGHAAAAAAERGTRARLLLPRAQELVGLGREVSRTRARLDDLGAERRDLDVAVHDLPQRQHEVASRLTALHGRATLRAAAHTRVEQARSRVDEQQRLTSLRAQLGTARERRDDARAVRLAQHEALLSLREARLQGMAAELATAMAAGEDCPVCGSCEHPRPAVPTRSAPTALDERAQQRCLDDATIALDTHEDQVRGLRASCEQLAGSLGEAADAPAVLLAEQDDAERALAEADAAAADLETTTTELERIRHDLHRHEVRLAEVRSLHDTTAHRLEDLLDRAATIAAELDDQLGEQPASVDAVRALADQHDAAAAALRRAVDLVTEQRHRAAESVTAADRARVAAAGEGFSSAQDALGALLDEARCTRLQQDLDERSAREAHAHRELGDEAVRSAAGSPVPDLDALTTAAQVALDQHSIAGARHRAAGDRVTRLEARALEVSTALAAWAPVRDELEVAASLAELAEGRGGDNTHQMRLSAYVLSARLSQVVAAANERLVDMTDHRYLLEHSAGRAVHDRRGGLSLRVRDQWTDELRDPVTLSGGETFVVSLALALGLADVVTGEAGGVRVDTLFVDEGFGSLDPDTLELVMDTLDQLREGGRVVGVVSHVPELRSRIGTQLQVHKTRNGSTVELRRVVA